MQAALARVEANASELLSGKIAEKVAEVYRQIRDPDLYPGEAAWLCVARGVCGTIDTVVGCPPLTLESVLTSIAPFNEWTHRAPRWIMMYDFISKNETLMRQAPTKDKQLVGRLLDTSIENGGKDDGSEKRWTDFVNAVDAMGLKDPGTKADIKVDPSAARTVSEPDDQQYARKLWEGCKDTKHRARLHAVLKYGCAVDFDELQRRGVARLPTVSMGRGAAQQAARQAALIYFEALAATIVHTPFTGWLYARAPGIMRNGGTRDALRYAWPLTFALVHGLSERGLYAARQREVSAV
jgi:hypothetical protein